MLISVFVCLFVCLVVCLFFHWSFVCWVDRLMSDCVIALLLECLQVGSLVR